MIIQTIGFTKKTAEEFFKILGEHGTELVIDTRINNKTQLSGFAKGYDLEFFLNKISGISYDYRPDFAPTKELLKLWRDKLITWEQYESEYYKLLLKRKSYLMFLNDYKKWDRICILCSESTDKYCHRRLLSSLLFENFKEIEEVVNL